MTLADIIILIVVILIIASVIFFGFFHKKKNQCSGCAYVKDCKKAKIEEKKETEKNEEQVIKK